MLFCDIENGKVVSRFTIEGLVTPVAIDDDGAQGLIKRTVNSKAGGRARPNVVTTRS